jgi:hypothetical protein
MQLWVLHVNGLRHLITTNRWHICTLLQLKGVLKTAPPHKVFPLKDVHAAIAEHEKPGHGGRKVFLQ